MSLKITVQQLQEQLPELLDHAVAGGEECIIERDGQEYAVLIGAREWRRLHQGSSNRSPRRAALRSEAVGAAGPDGLPASRRETRSDQDRRLREIGAKLDALGPEYRLAPEKQA